MKQDIIIYADGTREWVTPAKGESYTLKELQGFVGGWIEIVTLAHDAGHVLVVNEEGKLWNEPFNKDATIIAQVNDHPFEIVGNAFYCSKERIK